jgi:hypothetical protein
MKKFFIAKNIKFNICNKFDFSHCIINAVFSMKFWMFFFQPGSYYKNKTSDDVVEEAVAKIHYAHLVWIIFIFNIHSCVLTLLNEGKSQKGRRIRRLNSEKRNSSKEEKLDMSILYKTRIFAWIALVFVAVFSTFALTNASIDKDKWC